MHLDSPSKYTPPPGAELGSGKGPGGGEQKLEVSWRLELMPRLSPIPLLALVNSHSSSSRKHESHSPKQF